MNQKISTEKLIELIENVVSNFDPTPLLVNNDFPLRWESNLFISDYDFATNYLELDKDEESSSGMFFKSIGSAVVLDINADGSFEYWDGFFMIETSSDVFKTNSKQTLYLSLLNILYVNCLLDEISEFTFCEFSFSTYPK